MSDDSTTRLILICGLPGSGKTTLASRLALEHSALALGADQWMHQLEIDLFDEETRAKIEALQWSIAQELLTLGKSVILEFGFWLRVERDEKRLVARSLGAKVELHVLDVPFEERWRRIETRNANRTSLEGRISRGQLEEYDHYFEAPSDDEITLFEDD